MKSRGSYDCSLILENIGSVFFYTCDFLYFGLDHRTVVMLSDLEKKI